MAVNWSEDISTTFYGMTTTTTENIITTEFESGKKRTRLKNSSPKRTFSVKLDLWTKEEETGFWTWYDTRLHSRAQTVWLPDFFGRPEMKEYRMTAEPTCEGQRPKILSLSFEEV